MMNRECRLSKLQWFILNGAARQETLFYGEVLEKFFGWQPMQADPTGLESPGRAWHRFSRKKIGEKQYRKVMASLSRSCRRLQQRGLVSRFTDPNTMASGVRLTEFARSWLGQQGSSLQTPIMASSALSSIPATLTPV